MYQKLFALVVIMVHGGLYGCGRTPTPVVTNVHQAAIHYPHEVPNLIARGANIDALDQDGNSALWLATRFSKIDVVLRLLDANADVDLPNNQGWTPLHCSTFCGNEAKDVAIVEAILDAGADPNAVEPTYGETPLHYAVKATNSPEMVKLLIDAGADVNATSTSGDTPLQFAVAKGNSEIAEVLLAAGADPEITNQVGFRPIDQLNSCPHPELIQAVFRGHGADAERDARLR
jgi:ankyrin repeat protein